MDLLGDIPEPRHYPLSMRRFGVNPYGDPLFRLVFASSVKGLVGGQFADGYTGYRARPAYRHLGDQWVLEKWIPALEMYQMTEEQYNLRFRDWRTGLILTGPYQPRGGYFFAEALGTNVDSVSALATITKLVLKAKLNSPAENALAIRRGMEAEEKADEKMRLDWAKDKMPAYGIRAANLGGHVKATKSRPQEKTAHELRLPRSVRQSRKRGTTYAIYG